MNDRGHYNWQAAQAFLADHPVGWTFEQDGHPCINPDHVGQITDDLMHVIGIVIASLIDAGSERDAVMENEELYEAISREVGRWTGR